MIYFVKGINIVLNITANNDGKDRVCRIIHYFCTIYITAEEEE
jgi:hypothetical protein